MPQATPKMLTKQLREVEEDRGMVMLFEKLAHERYSVRSFQSKPVEKEKIQKIIAIANSAPTATNAQPVHIWAIVSEEGVRKVNETTKCGFGAPAVLVLGTNVEEAWTDCHIYCRKSKKALFSRRQTPIYGRKSKKGAENRLAEGALQKI